MFAQCPGCYSIYRMDAGTLARAGGLVRCSVCELRFNAVPTLRDQLPAAAPETPEPGNGELDFQQDAREPPVDEAVAIAAATETRDRETARTGRRNAYAWAQHPASWAWLGGSAVLIGLLLFQLFYRSPAALARLDGWRPVAEALCAVSGCELPPRRDLSLIQLTSRDVRRHPSVPGALIVSATMVNRADFTQPYPILELRLSDLQGRLVAVRRFGPETYLPADIEWRAGLPPDRLARLNLEMLKPGNDVVGFEFVFRPGPRAHGEH